MKNKKAVTPQTPTSTGGVSFTASPPAHKFKIHISHLTTLWRCGEQYRRRYVKGEIIPPGIALIVGSATHKSIEKNLQEKMITGKLLPKSVISDMVVEDLRNRFEEGINPDDEMVKELGKKKVKNIAEKQAVACSLVHREKLAPKINPIAIEDSFEFQIENSDWKLKGTSDIEEERNGKIILRDTKTANRRQQEGSADTDMQLTMYSLKVYKQRGKLPDLITKDIIIKPSIKKVLNMKSIKEVKENTVVQVLETKRTLEDLKPLLKRISLAIKQIKMGIFPPALENTWYCNPRWCGYYRTCPYVIKKTKK